MEEIIVPIVVIPVIFLGLPWIIFHYITRWKSQATLTSEDENLLNDMHDMARRLEERLSTIERIMSAENPGWRSLSHDPASSYASTDLGQVDQDLERLRSLRK